MSKNEIIFPVHRPSMSELLFFLLCGAILSVPLTLFVQGQIANQLISGVSAGAALFISVAIFAPLIEEFSKVFPLFYRHGETQRSIVNLAIFVGLGFGTVEFLTYVFALGIDPIVRIPGLFFHPASVAIAAYGIAVKKPWIFYFMAVGLHFINNFLALVISWFPVSVVVVITTIVTAWQLRARTKEKLI